MERDKAIRLGVFFLLLFSFFPFRFGVSGVCLGGGAVALYEVVLLLSVVVRYLVLGVLLRIT